MRLLTTATEERAFWAEIKARPGDSLPLQVFADWLDEQRYTSLAFALRWAAERKRFPHVTPAGRVVSWWRQPVGRIRRIRGTPSPWMLPAVVFDQLRLKQTNKCKAGTVSHAFHRLADALAVLRHAVGWNI